MKHNYQISGMTCKGCQNHVQSALAEVEGVIGAEVDLEEKSAVIEMKEHISLDKLRTALREGGGSYGIYLPGEVVEQASSLPSTAKATGAGRYYCPMHCEGEKTYDRTRDCPICGMELVSMEPETEDSNDESKHLKSKFWVAVIFTVPIFLIAMSDMLTDNPLHSLASTTFWNWTQMVLSLPVVFYATWMFFERAYRSIVSGNLNMFTLIGIGAGVAWTFSLVGMLFPSWFPAQFKGEGGTVFVYFEAATVILTLVLLGQLLEARAHQKTNSAVRQLLKLSAKTAIRIVDGVEEEVPLDQIEVGDRIRVRPGEKIPTDAVVETGSTSIDESMISGEPVPVSKVKGDSVIGGTINTTGSLEIRATKVGSQTVLAQIIEMVNIASRSKAPVQRYADKIAGYFVPAVFVIALITFVVWSLFGPAPAYVYGFVNAISVLIIACPCALGLATPMSIMVGVGKGAQSGVLIKNAEALEKLNQVDVLIIDKTGTVTEGKPSVEKIVVWDGESEKDVLGLMASLSQLSEHPLSQAILRKEKEDSVDLLKVDRYETVVGMGIKGVIDGQLVGLGNEKLLAQMNVSLPTENKKRAEVLQSSGKTISFLTAKQKVIGMVVIHDQVKSGSQQAIKTLQELGVRVVMLTGDNAQTAEAVAKEVNISEFKASMLPEDKLAEIRSLQNDGFVVAMAGDGINDAPALTQSDVGIAMGTGTDVAIESAAITLVKGDLNGIVHAKKLSGKVMQNIKQNFFFAFAYNILGIPIAAGVLYPFLGLLLSPMIAAAAMSFSSVSVILNALRLRSIRLN